MISLSFYLEFLMRRLDWWWTNNEQRRSLSIFGITSLAQGSNLLEHEDFKIWTFLHKYSMLPTENSCCALPSPTPYSATSNSCRGGNWEVPLPLPYYQSNHSESEINSENWFSKFEPSKKHRKHSSQIFYKRWHIIANLILNEIWMFGEFQEHCLCIITSFQRFVYLHRF